MATPQRAFRALTRPLSGHGWHLPALLAVPGVLAVAVLGVLLLGGGGASSAVDIGSAEGAPQAGGGGGSGYGDSSALEGELPAEEATPDNVVRSIDELHEVFGEPPFANLGRMRIPVLGIDAPLSLRIVEDDGAMPNPEGPDEVSLYDLSTWPGLGGRPGEGGNAIFAGHVDRRVWLDYAQVEYNGLAVFFYLDNLTPGAAIEVDWGGATHTYTVLWVREVAATSGEWAQIFGPDPSGAEAITLITCGGDFNAIDGSYASRVVVRAVRG